MGELRGVLDEVGDELLRDAVELVGLGGGQGGPVVMGGGGAEGDCYVAHFVELAGQGGEGLVEGGKGGVGGHELVGDVTYVLTHGVELLGGLGGGGGVGYLHFGHEEVVAHAVVELLCQTFALGFDAVDVAAGLFELGLALLVAAYFTYGRYLERLCGADAGRPVPSAVSFDGVDYIPMPMWKTFLVQLLNIAGLGPIFGAVLGAAYGPVAFLWITFGGIFMGAAHDFIAGMISLRNNGASLPETVGTYLGNGVKQLMRVFSVGLMVLVGAVFLSQPASLIANRIDAPALSGIVFGDFSWLLLIVLGVILVYYIVATLLPVDKIIGRIYPVFGCALLFMALGLLAVLLFSGKYTIPEFTSFRNQIADAARFPIVPMLFTTIACGAISGFHATQSPLMARCLGSERQARPVFYGAMISESIIALIWAAVAMAFWNGVGGLNAAIAEYGGQAAVMVDAIARDTLGEVLAGFVIFGVVACAITSGDTAFRSARLIVADFMGVEQRSLRKRIYISVPLFAAGLVIIFCLPFQTMWSYFAWMNQTLAMVTLWMITAFLNRHGRNRWVGLIPATVMTYVCSSYVFVSPLMCGMRDRAAAYLLGGAVTLVLLIILIFKMRRDAKSLP